MTCPAHLPSFSSVQEATTLLSAASLALRQTLCPLPLFLPTEDALRDGARGLRAVFPDDSGAPVIELFESDSVHGSQLPRALFYPGHQLGLMARRCEAEDPAAAAACRTAAAGLPGKEDGRELHGHGTNYEANHARGASARLSSRASFALPAKSAPALPLGPPFQGLASLPPWATPLNPPARCQLDLDLVWRYEDAREAVIATDSEFDPGTASSWRLVLLDPDHERDDGYRGFALRAASRGRRLLRPAAGTKLSQTDGAAPPDSLPLCACLGRLGTERRWVEQAAAVEELADRDWWLRRGLQTAAPVDGADPFVAYAVASWLGPGSGERCAVVGDGADDDAACASSMPPLAE